MRHRNGSEPHKRPAPKRWQADTGSAPAAALLRKPVTSLTTTDRLGNRHPMKSLIACANEARPAKVSSARWAVSGGRAGKVHALHRGFGLKYAARVFDSGGAHRTSSPGTRRQPQSLFTAASQACPRRPPAIDIRLPSRRVPDGGESRNLGFSHTCSQSFDGSRSSAPRM